MSLHTATYRGKKVRIITRSGAVIIDRFLGRTPSKWILLEKRGRIHAGEVRAFAPYRKMEEEI